MLKVSTSQLWLPCVMPAAVRGKKRKSRSDVFKQRFRKNFSALLEEEVSENSIVVYVQFMISDVTECKFLHVAHAVLQGGRTDGEEFYGIFSTRYHTCKLISKANV